MKLNELILWLESKQKFKEKKDLKKMYQALEMLNNPQNNYKTIHITGTNGKGSTAKFISAVLSQQYSVGLFTSPYIVKFNERIQLNDRLINDQDLKEYISWAKDFEQKYFKLYEEYFSYFELLTIIAYKYFSDKKVDYAIIEVGIGGLLDSTNVINSDLSIITSVGLDHKEQLGETIEEILLQKCGIVKKDGMLITGLKEYKTIIDNYINKVGATVKYINLDDYKRISNIPLKIMYKDNIYTSNLLGTYQINNMITAIEALLYLLPNISTEFIKRGIIKAVNPGRFEIIKDRPITVLDGAHNVEAVKELIKSIKLAFENKNIYVLFTSMLDKPYKQMIELLGELTNNLYLTSLQFPRVVSDFGLYHKKYKVNLDPIKAYNDLLSKIKEDDVLLITGSMYLVSEIRNYIIKED